MRKSLQKEERPHMRFPIIPIFYGLALMDIQNHPYPIFDEKFVVLTMEWTMEAASAAYTDMKTTNI